MKKSVAMKMFLIMLISVICISMTSFVSATDIEDLDNVEDLDLTSNSANNTSSGNTAGNNTSGNNSNNTNRTNTGLSTNLISSGNNTRGNTNATNTNLPKTGIGDVVPVAALIVVFGISAVYAYRKINEYMKINPPTVDSLIGIAASYQSLSDNAHAIEYYKKAMELDNKNDEIPFYIASIYANNNDFDNAKQYIEISLNKNPSNKQAKELSSYINDKMTEGLLSKAVELYDSKQYNESISLFNDIIKINPSNANVYYYRALAYDAVNNYKKAIEDYKSTLKYAPDMYIAYYSLGVDYDSINNYQEAKENYKKYVELCMEDNDYKQYAEKRIQEIN